MSRLLVILSFIPTLGLALNPDGCFALDSTGPQKAICVEGITGRTVQVSILNLNQNSVISCSVASDFKVSSDPTVNKAEFNFTNSPSIIFNGSEGPQGEMGFIRFGEKIYKYNRLTPRTMVRLLRYVRESGLCEVE